MGIIKDLWDRNIEVVEDLVAPEINALEFSIFGGKEFAIGDPGRAMAMANELGLLGITCCFEYATSIKELDKERIVCIVNVENEIIPGEQIANEIAEHIEERYGINLYDFEKGDET